MEGELESERERIGCQRRRQQGQLVEGEPERGMALCQVDRGVERLETAHRLYEEEEHESLAVGRRLLPRGVGRSALLLFN